MTNHRPEKSFGTWLISPIPWLAPLVCYLLLSAFAPRFPADDTPASDPLAAAPRTSTSAAIAGLSSTAAADLSPTNPSTNNESAPLQPLLLASTFLDNFSASTRYLVLNAVQLALIGGMVAYWLPIYRRHFPLFAVDRQAECNEAGSASQTTASATQSEPQTSLLFQHPQANIRGIGLGVVVGIVGLGIWIGLSWLQLESYLIVALNTALESVGLSGLSLPDRPGFNPFDHFSGGRLVLFLALRFSMLVAVVPLAEEVFVRGFLVRMVDHGQWWKANFGNLTRGAIVAASVYGAATHPEVLAAIVWFAMVTWLMVHTRSIWPCITAHATTNLLLGLYVICFQQWQLW